MREIKIFQENLRYRYNIPTITPCYVFSVYFCAAGVLIYDIREYMAWERSAMRGGDFTCTSDIYGNIYVYIDMSTFFRDWISTEIWTPVISKPRPNPNLNSQRDVSKISRWRNVDLVIGRLKRLPSCIFFISPVRVRGSDCAAIELPCWIRFDVKFCLPLVHHYTIDIFLLHGWLG